MLKFSETDFREMIRPEDHEIEKKLFRGSCDTLWAVACANDKVSGD